MRHKPTSGERAFILALRQRIAGAYWGSGDGSLPPQKSARRRHSTVSLGIGDDCAILRPRVGDEILLTTDFTLETIHFRREWHTPESVGHRCLARGLSDLAAMGAQPLASFLSLALPAEMIRSRVSRSLSSRARERSWRERFFDGFLALAERFQVPLAGGDTAQTPLIAAASSQHNLQSSATGLALMDIVLVGTAPRGRALRRSGAKAGDRIYATGFLGGAAAELEKLAKKPRRFRNATATAPEIGMPNPHPHLFPEPRLTIGAWLLKNRRTLSAIDISDGLSTDLDHLCEESGLAATISASAIPVHPMAQGIAGLDRDKALQLALHGGEDYELLFTASAKMHVPRRIAGVPVTCIGFMRAHESRTPRVLIAEVINGRERVQPLPPGGWEHFA